MDIIIPEVFVKKVFSGEEVTALGESLPVGEYEFA